MTIELKKKTQADGSILFYVYINGSCEKCFLSIMEAEKYYNSLTTSEMVEVLLTKEIK